MSSDVIDRRYFIIEGGKALELVEQGERERMDALASMKVFATKWGCKQVGRINGVIVGLVFPDDIEVPKEWKRDRKSRYLSRPRMNTKAGKAVALEFTKARGSYDPENIVAKLFIGDTWVLTSDSMMAMGAYGKVGKAWMASCHKDAKASPIDGMREIKASEYVAMLEESKAKL